MLLKLDQRIRKDLEDLLYNHEISEAITLNNSQVLNEQISSKGLPVFFTGDRKADTVLVMLNPRQNAEEADWDYRCQIYKLFIDDQHGPNAFFNTYLDAMTNFGKIDRYRNDPFDLKQAYFLQHWKGSDVILPKDFTNNSGTKLDKDIALTAKENVLTQKLQLELVPYRSSTFGINKSHKEVLMPYLETIFDEIFAHERTYVIFCSNIFGSLFNKYNHWTQREYFINMGTKMPVSAPSSAMIGNCTKLRIKKKIDENNNEIVGIPAIIAHTFPKRNLARDAKRMREYGKACFDHFNTKP